MSYLNQLLEKYKSEKILLIGKPSSYPTDIKLVDASYMDISNIIKNYRMTSFHATFDVICICDPSISNFDHWSTIFDEIIRFTKNRGILIVHASSTVKASVWGIKSFISDKINLRARLLSQQVLSRKESFFEMELSRERNLSKNWSIGIPSDGHRNTSVLALINSLQIAKDYLFSKAKIKIEIDIMIIGDQDKLFDGYPVRFINQSLEKNLAALGEKKYIIGNNAIYENILIIHDRYQLDKSFFLGFEKWGYDFEFCTTQQYDSKGNVYDPLLIIENFNRADAQMFRVTDQSYPYERMYINGGLTVVKKSIINQINFNPNLLHSEAEDIDYSGRLNSVGIIARFNPYSVAITSTDVDQSNLLAVPKI